MRVGRLGPKEKRKKDARRRNNSISMVATSEAVDPFAQQQRQSGKYWTKQQIDFGTKLDNFARNGSSVSSGKYEALRSAVGAGKQRRALTLGIKDRTHLKTHCVPSSVTYFYCLGETVVQTMAALNFQP